MDNYEVGKMQTISILIPVRNRSIERLKEVTSRLRSDLVKEIIIVDYGSDEMLKFDNLEKGILIRSECKIWNKAHALNICFKKSTGDYIMTLDADILLAPDFFDKITPLINSNNFIFTNRVKRIEKEDLSDNWEKMLGLSRNWLGEGCPAIQEINNTATGGFQLFPRKFFEDIRGLDENLIYYGGMDNITLIEARRYGLNVINMNETLLHLEHKKHKEDNLPEEEREFAKYVRQDRVNLMQQILDIGHDKNPGWWGEEIPNDYLIKKYREFFNKMGVYNEGKDFLELPQNTKIMIAVMNNRETIPKRFAQDLFSVFLTTQSIFPNTHIHYISACQNNMMRNMAVMKSIELDYDYLVCLDDDHTYPEDFVIQLIGRNKDFITGCTRRRTKPYTPTQYYKFKLPLMTEDNFVYSDGKREIIKIEVSGPVGMLMKVNALKQLDYPYYSMDYSSHTLVLEESKEESGTYLPVKKPTPLGGDYFFCRQLKEKGFELWLDKSLDFPHYISGVVNAIGQEDNPEKAIIDLV